jgi:hypothetical protein
MKKFIILSALSFLVSFYATAQKWTEMMHDPNANFYDIVKEFDNYWKDKDYERGKGYKAFKRWQWFMEKRVYPSGDLKFGSRAYAIEKYNEFLKENAASGKLSSSVTSATTSNWVPLGPFGSPAGGDAGRVQVIRVHPTDPNTFYVGTAAGGFWMTNNGGTTYTTTTDHFASLGVSDIALHPTNPNIIYISTGDKDAGDTHSTGVLKSTDGGWTWTQTGLSFQVIQQRRIHRLLINPENPNTLIAATTSGMFKTVNGGSSWTQVQNGSYVDAEYKPGDTTVVYAVTNGGFQRSTNGGNSFSGVSISGLNSNRLSLAVTPGNSQYVYVLASAQNNGFGGLYRSTNGGTSFTLMSSTPNIFDWSTNGSGSGGQGWYDIAIDASPTNPNEIIAGGVNTWKSTNGGSTWTLNTHWYGGGGRPYVHADLHHVLYVSGTTVYLGHDGGVSRTTNGTGWSTINGNMDIAQIYKLGLSANNPSRIVTGHQDNGTNLLNGTSWNEIYGGDGADCFIDWNNNNVIIASYIYGDFQRSVNGGASWSTITTGLTGNAAWIAPIVQSPANANTYFCGYQNVYKSTNQGSTWTQMGSIGAVLDEIRIAPSNVDIMYATSGTSIFKTSNGGVNWSNVNNGLPTGSAQITNVAIDNLNPNNVYVTLSGYSNGNKVFASSNGGASWTNYSTGLPNIPVNCIVYSNNSAQAIYVGTDVGVYYREASMSTWIPYFTGLPNVVVEDLEIYYPTKKLRAATYGRGVWETDLYSDPLSPPVAAYQTQFSPACINTALQFIDVSANTPTVWAWSFPGGSPATATVQNPIITYSATGIYTISLTSSNGNGSSPVYTSTISVVGHPTVSPITASVCTGYSGNIGVNTNANQVNWSTGQSGLNISVSNSVTTVYNFTASLGACNTTGTSTLFINPAPATPTVMVMQGYLTTTVIAQNYQWYLNGSAITGETTPTLVPQQNGWYSVWVSNGNCIKSSASLNVTNVGLEEIRESAGVLTVGPNPVKDQLIITFATGNETELTCEILNNLGQKVSSEQIRRKNSDCAIINVQNLAPGVYYVALKKGESKSVYKLIKQ